MSFSTCLQGTTESGIFAPHTPEANRRKKERGRRKRRGRRGGGTSETTSRTHRLQPLRTGRPQGWMQEKRSELVTTLLGTAQKEGSSSFWTQRQRGSKEAETDVTPESRADQTRPAKQQTGLPYPTNLHGPARGPIIVCFAVIVATGSRAGLLLFSSLLFSFPPRRRLRIISEGRRGKARQGKTRQGKAGQGKVSTTTT